MAESRDKTPAPDSGSSIPRAVVSRLSLYLRELQHLVRSGQETTSSNQLGPLLGFTDAQVRKDLAYFGQFGYPGIGYRCQELIQAIRGILGTDREWPVALMGIGNLGRALLRYKGFEQQGFRITAAFDIDSEKTGTTIEGVVVYDAAEMEEVVRRYGIQLGVIAVPAEAAQGTADSMVHAGLTGIMNFAPVTISLPDHVQQVGIDLAIELEQLSFAVVNRHDKR